MRPEPSKLSTIIAMLILDQVAKLDKETCPLAGVIALARDVINSAIFAPGGCEALPTNTNIPRAYLQAPYFELLRKEQSKALDAHTAIKTDSKLPILESAQSLGTNISGRSQSRLNLAALNEEVATSYNNASKGPQTPWLAIMDQIYTLPRLMRRALFAGIAAVETCDLVETIL